MLKMTFSDSNKYQRMIEDDQEPGSKEAQQIADQWMVQVNKMFEGKQYLQEKMWDVNKNHSDDVAFYPMN